jgi:tetratricopeptide (TPR) repeat protein
MKNLDPDDKTGVGALAAAHANRGIVLDRTGRYEEALDSYVESLKIDQEVVEGPGVVHKILYGGDRVSSVRDRAVYIYEQLKLPEEERVLSVPEIDEQQRMHKP